MGLVGGLRFIKDEYDLSANIRSGWDNVNLYFLFEINDSRQKKMMKKKRVERNIFVDFGWIKNYKGDKVWEMHPKQSQHAGGAYRNQMVDTVLNLKRGKYFVKYVSDETHSHNNWNKAPPKTSFYGIVVYRFKS